MGGIDVSQVDEIKMMQRWLEDRGQTVPMAMAHDGMLMPGMSFRGSAMTPMPAMPAARPEPALNFSISINISTAPDVGITSEQIKEVDFALIGHSRGGHFAKALAAFLKEANARLDKVGVRTTAETA